MLQDQLADVLSALKNADKIGQKEIVTRASKEIKAVLEILHEKGYIVSYEFLDNGKSGIEQNSIVFYSTPEEKLY